MKTYVVLGRWLATAADGIEGCDREHIEQEFDTIEEAVKYYSENKSSYHTLRILKVVTWRTDITDITT
jgi:hypothetical protein